MRTAMRLSSWSRRVLVAALAVASALAITVGPATALDLFPEPTECVGVLTGTHDNVVVPPGAVCVIESATIKGNVKNYGSLRVEGTTVKPTTVGGSIEADPGHLNTFLNYVHQQPNGVIVEGDVHIIGGVATGDSSGYFSGTRIRGNFQYEENRPPLFAYGGNIGGNLKAQRNTGGGGLISGNTIAGNLECKENEPPISEVGNSTFGTERDKCPEPES